ncbi:hypothetical protein ACVW19_000184 [Streptomyces sp. TE5632]
MQSNTPNTSAAPQDGDELTRPVVVAVDVEDEE